MQFSGKITNSILGYVARRQWSRERLFEMTDLPYEFLRDPSYWLSAKEVEDFLASLTAEMSISDPNLLVEVGLAAHELRGWGVLDSVLKMMASPVDIYSQPQRFLSYFISPAPPIAQLYRDAEMVSFDLPIAQSEYPHVASYLAAALAGLPKYLGQEAAAVDWKANKITIRWTTRQGSLLKQVDNVRVPRPELVDRLVRDVEVTQARLETRDLEVARLEREVKELQTELRRLKGRASEDPLAQAERRVLSEQLALVRDLNSKLMDCMTRAHQAVGFARTLLQNEIQFQSVIRRVDWENARTQYPWYHLQIVELIERMQHRLLSSGSTTPDKVAEGASVAEVIHDVVEQWRREHPGGVEIQETAVFDPSAQVNRERFSVVLNHLLASASESINHMGRIEILGRHEGVTGELRFIQYPRRVGRPRVSQELPLFAEASARQTFDDKLMSDLLKPLGGQIRFNETPGEPKELVCVWDLH